MHASRETFAMPPSEASAEAGTPAEREILASAGLFPSASGSLVVLAIVAAAFNFLSYPIMRSCQVSQLAMLLVGPVCFGVIFGELVALALWLVWGEGRFLWRLLIHWAVALGLLGSLMLGLALAFGDGFFRNSSLTESTVRALATLLCVFPAVSLATQLPLWPLRIYLGWRLEQASPAPDVHRRQALSIHDMLAGTGVVALTLGLARATPAFDASTSYFFWVQLLSLLIAALVASVTVAIPALLFLMRWKEQGPGVAALVLYLILAIFVFIVILLALSGARGGGPPGEVFFALVLSVFAFGAAVAAPLLVLRSSGYRLVWPRDRRAGR
jgi:hypothetical protein